MDIDDDQGLTESIQHLHEAADSYGTDDIPPGIYLTLATLLHVRSGLTKYSGEVSLDAIQKPQEDHDLA
jgi:hypothetical protein